MNVNPHGRLIGLYLATASGAPMKQVKQARGPWSGLLKESYGRRGVLAKVVAEGELREGADVVLGDVNPDAPRPIRPKLP